MWKLLASGLLAGVCGQCLPEGILESQRKYAKDWPRIIKFIVNVAFQHTSVIDKAMNRQAWLAAFCGPGVMRAGISSAAEPHLVENCRVSPR